jgi:uncharacterized protein
MTALATVSGMDRETGHMLSGVGHVRQSILDILTTHTGARVCNRGYGSDLPDMIDAPMNEAGIQSLYAATAIAVATWYPFITLTKIDVTPDASQPGQMHVTLAGFENGADETTNPFTLAIPLGGSGAPLFN